jgi:hypothetical protein
MTTETRLTAIVLAVATLASAALLSPAAAETKAAPPKFTAPTSAVTAACDRTVGCSYQTTGGITSGCSPNVCFVCSKESCAPLVRKGGSGNPVGRPPVGLAHTASAPPTTHQASSHKR